MLLAFVVLLDVCDALLCRSIVVVGVLYSGLACVLSEGTGPWGREEDFTRPLAYYGRASCCCVAARTRLKHFSTSNRPQLHAEASFCHAGP